MGDLLNGVPRSSKETWIIVFCPGFKWVCGSDRVVIFWQVGLIRLATCQKFLASGFMVR
nr:MAG TPA: hypothetical protein [Caudoviricetes sp.]